MRLTSHRLRLSNPSTPYFAAAQKYCCACVSKKFTLQNIMTTKCALFSAQIMKFYRFTCYCGENNLIKLKLRITPHPCMNKAS
jgi:hypothetical protein